jgi:predicted HTH domain antitoxin
MGTKHDWEISQLVKAKIYPDADAVMRSAIQALFLLRPEQKLRMVISAYTRGEISLGKAAELMGVCNEEMKEIFRQMGVKLHLGPRTIEELRKEIENFESS